MFTGLGLAWFVGAVAWPVWHTHRTMKTAITRDLRFRWQRGQQEKKAILRVGGQSQAVRRLVVYIRLPDWVATEKEAAYQLLGRCGQPGLDALVGMIDDTSQGWTHRYRAARALGGLADDAIIAEAEAAITRAVSDVRRQIEEGAPSEQLTQLMTSLKVARIDLRAVRQEEW
jgi:hypothetical protein